MANLDTVQTFNILATVMIAIIPLWLTLIIRSFVKASRAEKRLSAVSTLSDMALDYAEHLDRRGELQCPPDTSKSAQKRQVAAAWLVAQLRDLGIHLRPQEAEQWVSAAFQARMGGLQNDGLLRSTAARAVTMLQTLGQDENRSAETELAMAADWLVAEMAAQGTAVTRDEAAAWITAEQFDRLANELPDDAPLPQRLDHLAARAAGFLRETKLTGELTLQTDADPAVVEADIMLSWLLVETVRQHLCVTPQQLGQALDRQLSGHPRPAAPPPPDGS